MQVLLLPSVVTLTAAQSSPDYLREVKPLLEHKCYACHGGLKQKAGLRLDTAVNIRKGGKNGPAIVLGKPNESLLIRKVSEADEAKRMPQQASELTKDEINLLKRWIAAGASAPSDEKEQQDPRAHWSYQVVAKPEVPVGGRDQRSAVSGQMGNAIDAFLAVEQRRLGLKLAPAAEKPILLRRVYLDLIGLPPTPAELKSFAEDDSKGAYAKVVDRLLDDPRYGERWGRHWMDIWRYSDWYGRRGQNEIRYSMRHIWRWRDWIVQSLNDDKGYDRMIVEMLAGDEVAPTDEGALAATGFVGRNWYKFDRNVWLFDAVERTSQALLGLTMRCARCHDHKYDPITQEDYYRFRAFFEPHGVRTDAVSAQVEKVNDNNSKLTLKEGLSRVYDEELNTNTYVFRRGRRSKSGQVTTTDPGRSSLSDSRTGCDQSGDIADRIVLSRASG